MQYRPEIDGLRAIAVLTVILYHAGFSFIQGGYLGVDIFFVISGFLITSIIRSEIIEQKFSLANFYERRIRRIIPPLYLVMSITLGASWFILTPAQLKDLYESTISIVLYFSNFHFWLQSDYFAADASLSPLLHTWSLAVEEQFYFIFPLLLMLMMKLKKIKAPNIILMGCIASLITTIYIYNKDPNANFFFTSSRAWELGIGCWIACLPATKPIHKNYSSIITSISLVTILVCMFLFNHDTLHPGPLTIIPVLATAALIRYVNTETATFKILAHKYMVRIGLYSYSAYLWHQPIFALFRIKSDNTPELWQFLPLILVTFLCAHITWKFLEKPVRNKQTISFKKLIIAISLISIIFLGLSALAIKNQGFPERFGKTGTLIYTQQQMATPYNTTCLENYSKKNLSQLIKTCSLGTEKEQYDFILWGDSHAASLAYGLNASAKNLNLKGLQLTSNGCPSSKDITRLDNKRMQKNCPKDAERALQIIEELKPQYVIILNRWALQFEGSRFDNKLGGKEHGSTARLSKTKHREELTHEELSAYYLDYMQNLNHQLAKHGTKLILIQQIPEAGWNVPQSMFYNIRDKKNVSLTLPRQTINDRNQKVNTLFKKLNNVSSISQIDPVDILCDKNLCYHSENDIPLYFDDDHLSKYASKKLADYIFEYIQHSHK